MNKFILILAGMMLVLQIEMFALLWLDSLNLKVWNSQAQLNDQLINAFTNECML